ncbi:MAG TPA: ArsA family ATPase, partial [Blastocatellia bacterium]|nr:ArsA family ATPase [Blastocatellia bacterium]
MVTDTKCFSSRGRPKFHDSPGSKTTTIPRYLFFGGKGGVGKTTAAAATAMWLLERAGPGESILLFSTDPAHSLSDCLRKKIGRRPTAVARRGSARLLATEMNPESALARFNAAHKDTLAEIADRGTILDRGDVNQLLNLSLPGLDELMALFELSEHSRRGLYSHIVVDTAPSGHASRLFRLPDTFAHWLQALDQLCEKHRFMTSLYTRRRRPKQDAAEAFLSDFGKRLDVLRAMFCDINTSALVLVTLPEAMCVDETVRYRAALVESGVPVSDLIINRIERDQASCAYCRGRHNLQRPYLKRIRAEFGDLRLHSVPLLSLDVSGPVALRDFASAAWGKSSLPAKPIVNEKARRPSARHQCLIPNPQSTSCPVNLGSKQLLVFGGKGGVGKTTAAASAALALAESNSSSR